MTKWIHIVAMTIIGAGSAGCTTVHVSGAEPSITQGIGFVLIQLDHSNQSPQVVATESFGMTATNHSTTLGYVKEVSVWLPDTAACRVLIVTEKNADVVSLREAMPSNLDSISNICFVSKEGKSWLQ